MGESVSGTGAGTRPEWPYPGQGLPGPYPAQPACQPGRDCSGKDLRRIFRRQSQDGGLGGGRYRFAAGICRAAQRRRHVLSQCRDAVPRAPGIRSIRPRPALQAVLLRTGQHGCNPTSGGWYPHLADVAEGNAAVGRNARFRGCHRRRTGGLGRGESHPCDSDGTHL